MTTGQWILGGILVLAGLPALAAERPTAEELLAAYEKSVERLSSVRLEYAEKSPERPYNETEKLQITRESVIHRNGSRWMIDHLIRQTAISSDSKRESTMRHNFIVGDQMVDIQLIETREGMPVPIEQGLRVGAWLDWKNGQKPEPRGGFVPLDPERVLWNVLGNVQFLFGRLHGDADQTIWEVMRDSSVELLPETEAVGGIETYVVKSEGKFGTHKLWLDPKSGGLPRRVEVSKKLGHLYDDNQLGSRIGQPAEPPRFDRKGPPPNRKPDLRDSIFSVADIRIENHDGVFVITAWNQREKLTRGDGKTMGGEVEMTVSAVNFKPETWPENAFRPGIEVPEKTRVIARDADRRTEYEWVNGRVQVRAGN